MPVIIPISEHCHEPMTIEQKHTLIGCFILIHLIWLITTIISFVKYKIANYKHFGWYYFDDDSIIEFWHIIMTFIGIIEILIVIGYFIGKLL